MTWQTTTELLPHQVAAVAKLRGARVAALFMEMGTGKTRTAIEFARLRQHKVSRVLWFCPVSLKETVRHEILKHTDCAPADVYVFDAHTKLPVPPAWWYVIGLESIGSSNRVLLAAHSLIDANAFVIVDESSYIKGHHSRRTLRLTKLAETARYRMLLTGTPISQGVVDLYAQMRFLSPQILGYNSFYSFAANHLEYSEKFPGMVIASHNIPYLAAKTQPYTYQVTKAECLDLPDKWYDERQYSMTLPQRELYEAAKAEMLLEIEAEEFTSYTIFRLFTILQQIVGGWWRRGDELLTVPHKRLTHLADIVRSMPTDAKIIIWSKYLRSLDDIYACLAADYGAGSIACFDGRRKEAERHAELARFRQDARFLLATPASGGHGLTLNEAHHVIFYDNSFKYSERIQAEDRCHRIGQTQPVTYVDLVCYRSIDERIMKALREKEDAVQQFKRAVDKVKGSRDDAMAQLAQMVKSL